MSSSRPYASSTPSDLITEDTRVSIVRPITARVARIIPGDDGEYIDSVPFSQNSRGLPSHLMASTIHSRTSQKVVWALIKRLWFPSDVIILLPRISDTVCNPPLDSFSIYVEHIRSGLRFPLLPLIIEILDYYGIASTQLVPNAIRVVVGFERLCRLRGVVSSLALFQVFFYLKSSCTNGWY